MMLRRWVIIWMLCPVFVQVFSQPKGPVPLEDSLYQLFQEFQVLQEPEERSRHNQDILEFMRCSLLRPETFRLRFDSLRKMAGILDSPDGLFRIFTWNIPLGPFIHEIHGVLQVKNPQENLCKIYILSDRFDSIPDLLHRETGPAEWPGALYYDIRRDKYRKEVVYTLMGYNFHDRWSDKKIIEILHFDPDTTPRFGKPVFSTPDGIQHRVIFEYSGDVAMNLRYNPDLKMIVYDHLSPIEPELEAHPRFYAPDFSYDGYKFRKGIWEYQADLDVRNR
jgi:hypothetical protein